MLILYVMEGSRLMHSESTYTLLISEELKDHFGELDLNFESGAHFQKASIPTGLLDKVQKVKKQLNHKGRTCLVYPNKSIKLAFFDMDSTVIKQETIVELADYAGTAKEVESITEQAMEGKLDFKEALFQRVATLEGLSTNSYEQVYQRLVIQDGMKEFAQIAQQAGVKLFLISGGFIPFAERLARELNFNGCHANELEVKDDKLTGKVIGEIVDAEAKKKFVIDVCRENGVKLDETLVVGDGANDLEMMSVAGIKVGFDPKPIVIEACDGAIFKSHSPLTELLTL